LENTTNRKGSGKVRLTHFYVEDFQGHKLKIIRSGQDIVFILGFKCMEDNIQNVIFGIAIHSLSGERLAVLYTSHTGHEFEKIPKKGEVCCYIPKFPFAPGKYHIRARVEVNGIEADFPKEGVGYIDVEAGDFYGTGKLCDKGYAPFLIYGNWSIRSL